MVGHTEWIKDERSPNFEKHLEVYAPADGSDMVSAGRSLLALALSSLFVGCDLAPCVLMGDASAR